MRFMVAGSGPCRQEVLLFFHALGVPLLEAYGTSECAVPISMNRPHDYKIGTVGRPLENIELYLEEEEVEVRSPGLFKGYENQRIQTNLTSGQFLSTGDIGQLDEEGYLTLLGRGSAMTKTSTGRKEVAADLEERWTT